MGHLAMTSSLHMLLAAGVTLLPQSGAHCAALFAAPESAQPEAARSSPACACIRRMPEACCLTLEPVECSVTYRKSYPQPSRCSVSDHSVCDHRDCTRQTRDDVCWARMQGLQHCQDTMVVDEGAGGGVRGVSGGERKRVTVGVGLVTQPRVLMLDEPTSGLDSETAVAIIELMQDLARQVPRPFWPPCCFPGRHMDRALNADPCLHPGRCCAPLGPSPWDLRAATTLPAYHADWCLAALT